MMKSSLQNLRGFARESIDALGGLGIEHIFGDAGIVGLMMIQRRGRRALHLLRLREKLGTRAGAALDALEGNLTPSIAHATHRHVGGGCWHCSYACPRHAAQRKVNAVDKRISESRKRKAALKAAFKFMHNALTFSRDSQSNDPARTPHRR